MARVQRRVRGAVDAMFDGTDNEVLIEGPAGTGKSHGDLAYIHYLCWHFPGSQHLICRATRVSMTESLLKTLEQQILGDHHPAYSGTAHRSNRERYEFPNKSTIVVGGLDNPEKLFSTEWDTVLVGEASEISEDDWEKLGRAMRSNKMPYQQRIAETNPAAPGHWLNRRARPIDDSLRMVTDLASWERLQRYNETPCPSRMRRMVSKHQDNPAYWDWGAWDYTPLGRKYIEGVLAQMTGHRRARLFEGRWVAAEGAVFAGDFDAARNVCPAFSIPSHWPVWFWMDPGFDHPCGGFWLTKSPTGRRFMVDCFLLSGATIKDIARTIRQREHDHGIHPIERFMDPRYGFSKTALGDGITLSQMWAEEGFEFNPWPRLQGPSQDAAVQEVRRLFHSAQLMLFDRCHGAKDEIESWKYKRNASGEALSGDDQYIDSGNNIIDPMLASVTQELRAPALTVNERVEPDESPFQRMVRGG